MTARAPNGISTETTIDGTQVVIRPLRPDDVSLYPEFFAHIADDDLRLRFFAIVKNAGPDLFDRLTHYDPANAMAFVALDPHSGALLGVVRLHDDPEGGGGEFAALVRTAIKGHGIGWLLMQRMIAYARWKQLKTVHGQVLQDNATMLQMCRELGFDVQRDPHERGVMVATLDLAKLAAAD